MIKEFKQILLLFIISFPIIINAQKSNYKNSDWIDGYIIPKPKKTEFSKDTVFCKISYPKKVIGGVEFYKIKILLKNGETTKIQASEIILFKRGDEYFESGYFNENYSFAKRIILGKVSLFTNKQSSYAPSGGMHAIGPISTTSAGVYYFKLPNTKKMIHFPSGLKYKKFIPFMETYFSDNKELIQLVKDEKLKSKDVIEIITIYNK